MAWHLHAIELQPGVWECRWGRYSYGTVPDLTTALRRLRGVAATAGHEGEFAIVVHYADGTVVTGSDLTTQALENEGADAAGCRSD